MIQKEGEVIKKGPAQGLLNLSHRAPMTSAGLIAILALTFYLRLLYFGQYIDADVGNTGYLAWRMAEGEILIDLEGPGKPPLYSMLYAMFIRLFGTSVLGLKIFGTFFVLMAVLAAYWLASQAYGKRVGLFAALLFGVFSSGPMVEGGTVNLETVLHLPYILAMGLFLKASMSGRLRWYFLAGLCATLAALVKQVGGVLFFVFLCDGIYERWKKEDSLSLREWLSRYSLLVGGALLPVIGVIIFYHFHGYTLSQLYDSMLGSNLRYIQRGHELTSLLEIFSFRLKGILPENGLLWVGTIFAAASLGWRIWQGKGKGSERILLLWAFWSFAVLWSTGTFFQHYFLQIVAPFSVLTAYEIVASWKWAKSLSPLYRFVAQGGWTILFVIMVIIFIQTDYKYFFSYTPIEQTVLQYKFFPVSNVSNDILVGHGINNIVQQQIAYYIRDQTDPTETIYVWGIAPQIYFLAQRKAATRYRNNFNMSVLVTDNPLKALQAYAPTVMEDIRKSHPVYIVQIFRLEDFPELQTFVRDQYIIDKGIELSVPPYRICLYRRR
jgi:4-amino-4-deoxy-L-arabinose transferase-like glycosyltransferase